jgi:methyl-accepting chemotaxis protein
MMTSGLWLARLTTTFPLLALGSSLAGAAAASVVLSGDPGSSSPLMLAGAVGLAATAATAIGLVLGRGASRSFAGLAAALPDLDKGAPVPGCDRGDEFGDLARALDAARSALTGCSLTRAAVDAGHAHLILADAQGVIVRASSGAAAMARDLGLGSDLAPGRPVASLSGMPGLTTLIQNATATPARARLRQGSRAVDAVVAPLRDQAGQRIGLLVALSDATAEEQAQREVAEIASAIAGGDFSRRARAEGSMQPVGDAINRIASVIEAAVDDFAASLESMARGDLTRGVEAAYDGRFNDLKAAINGTIAHLSETVTTIQATTRDVQAAAREINAGSDDLARRTEDEASSLQTTAATTEELAASVKASAQASREAARFAEQATDVAEKGGAVLGEAVEAMTRIEGASQRISEISTVIEDIAFQTNLLALNAAVEAARAGDAGAGFAVVASEVRALAQRSSDAAKDITAIISSSTAEVENGVRLVRSAGETFSSIVSASSKVANTVVEISTAASEQAHGIEEMSRTVAQLDDLTQKNAALAEQSAASATALANQVDRLNSLLAGFRTHGAAKATLQAAYDTAPAMSAPATPAPARKPVPAAAKPAPAAAKPSPAAAKPAPARLPTRTAAKPAAAAQAAPAASAAKLKTKPAVRTAGKAAPTPPAPASRPSADPAHSTPARMARAVGAAGERWTEF